MPWRSRSYVIRPFGASGTPRSARPRPGAGSALPAVLGDIVLVRLDVQPPRALAYANGLIVPKPRVTGLAQKRPRVLGGDFLATGTYTNSVYSLVVVADAPYLSVSTVESESANGAASSLSLPRRAYSVLGPASRLGPLCGVTSCALLLRHLRSSLAPIDSHTNSLFCPHLFALAMLTMPCEPLFPLRRVFRFAFFASRQRSGVHTLPVLLVLSFSDKVHTATADTAVPAIDSFVRASLSCTNLHFYEIAPLKTEVNRGRARAKLSQS